VSQHIDERPSSGSSDRLQDTAWHSYLAQQALIALQATCLVAGLWMVVMAITADPGLRFMPVLIFAAAAAGVASALWLARPAQRLVSKTAFNLAQLLLILVIVRVLTWPLTGNWPTAATLRGWILEPWSFLDGFFIPAAILCALAWHRASVVTDIFYRLALSPGELAYDSERRSGGFWRMAHLPERVLVSRAELVEQYVTQWLVGGVFLALFAAAMRVRISGGLSINVLSMGIPPQMAVAVVLYFLIGLVLLSQARLAVLRAQWLIDGVEMPERLPTRWGRVSMLVIVSIGVIAALLPLGSTWQIGAIVNVVVMFFVRIALFVVFLITALFALILSLFGEQPAMPEIPQDLVPLTPVQPLEPILEAPPWLGGATFWLIGLLVLLLALRLVLGRDGLDVTWCKLQALLARLWTYLKSWGRGVQSLARNIQVSLPGRRGQPTDNVARQPWRFIRLGGLSPREQVRYFYLSTLRRAADQGVVRQPAQTPVEFVRDLESTWPEAELDVEALTEAFVVARYDRAEIDPAEAQQVKSIWERIKRALRGKRKSAEGATNELH
jgi:hypothetical protein